MQRLYLLLEANLVNIFLHCFEFWFMQTNTWTNSINTYRIAGGSGFCDTWFLDLTENTWTKGPDMSTCRFKHTCSLLKDTNEIVIVGGSAKPTDSSCTRKDRVRLSSVEILDLKTNTFRDGKFKSQDIIIWIKCNMYYWPWFRHPLSNGLASSCSTTLWGLIPNHGRRALSPIGMWCLWLQKMREVFSN